MRIVFTLLCVLAASALLPAQTPPVSILEIQAENVVTYYEDTSDILSWGTLPGPVPLPANFTIPAFKRRISLGDVVSVNGQPVKGNFVSVTHSLVATTEMTPRRVLMDLALGCPFMQVHSFMLADGSVIGTIAAMGVSTVGRPPGAPSNALAGTGVIVGGSGAFLSVRGQAGLLGSSGVRNASVTEDPAYRRVNGGGKMTWFFQIVPAVWPEVITVPTGPAIYHGSDLSPVTLEKPARAGELLVMGVSGLGPVKGTLDPGQPFPAGALMEVNSPVDITVNGKRASVVNKIGWPTLNNVYRLDFVVPDGTAPGTASVVPAVAWINGTEAKIAIR